MSRAAQVIPENREESYLTNPEIDALQDAGLHRKSPFILGSVSQGMLSVARHFGGCKYQGDTYTYVSATDELIRSDVLRWLTKYRKEMAKKAPATAVPEALL